MPIAARRIGDHRKAYLDYEGPVSGGRGDVTRVDRGTVEIREFTEQVCVFKAGGKRLCGVFALRRSADEWVLDAQDRESAGGAD